MATKKITQLDAIIKADNDDVIPIVDVSGGTTNKITKGDFLKEVNKEIDEIVDDLENSKLTKKVSGTIIDVDDSAESRVKNIMFCGNSVQATTTGINLAKFDDELYEGITLTNGEKYGIIELNGTKEVDDIDFTKFLDLSPGTYYLNYGYVSGKIILNEDDNDYFSIIAHISDYVEMNFDEDSFTENRNISFVVSEDDVSGYLRISFYRNLEGFENFKFYFMLTKDEPSYNWESFTGGLPAPSQAYPQSINSVGEEENESGNITERIFNENWLMYDAESTTINGITYTVNEDKSITVQGTASGESVFNLIGSGNTVSEGTFEELPFIEEETYNFKGSNISDSNIILEMQKNRGGSGYIEYIQHTGSSSTFNHKPKDTYRMYIRVMSNQTVNGTIYPIINKGTEAIESPYIMHKGQTYLISVQEPMRSVGSVRDLFFKNTVDSKYYDETLTENAWYETHNIAYIDSYDGETITTNYISTTGGLDTGAGVQYVLETPRYLLCTEDQVEKLEEYVEASTYKNITYFFSTNDVPGYQNVSYLQNLAIFSRLEELEESKEDKSNKTTEINEDSTDEQYPSAKAVYNGLEEKQGTLTFDNTPTANSTNPVKSGGIKTYVDGIVGDIESILEELDIGGGI